MNEAEQRSNLMFYQHSSSFSAYNAPGLIGSAGRVFMGSRFSDASEGP